MWGAPGRIIFDNIYIKKQICKHKQAQTNNIAFLCPTLKTQANTNKQHCVVCPKIESRSTPKQASSSLYTLRCSQGASRWSDDVSRYAYVYVIGLLQFVYLCMHFFFFAACFDSSAEFLRFQATMTQDCTKNIFQGFFQYCKSVRIRSMRITYFSFFI